MSSIQTKKAQSIIFNALKKINQSDFNMSNHTDYTFKEQWTQKKKERESNEYSWYSYSVFTVSKNTKNQWVNLLKKILKNTKILQNRPYFKFTKNGK